MVVHIAQQQMYFWYSFEACSFSQFPLWIQNNCTWIEKGKSVPKVSQSAPALKFSLKFQSHSSVIAVLFGDLTSC